jgi:hypothetical protein
VRVTLVISDTLKTGPHSLRDALTVNLDAPSRDVQNM